jgi:hypothetical protein
MAKECHFKSLHGISRLKLEDIIHNTIHDLPQQKDRILSVRNPKPNNTCSSELRLDRPKDFAEFAAEDWLDLESYKAAEKFEQTINKVLDLGSRMDTLPAQDIGSAEFTSSNHKSRVETEYYQGRDTLKISSHSPLIIRRSPEASRLERKSRARQPALNADTLHEQLHQGARWMIHPLPKSQ